MNTPKMPLRNAVILFLASLIWGTAFVAQANGMEYLGPFTFNGIRSLMGTAVLTPLILVRRHFRVKREALGDRSTGTYSLQNTVKAGVARGADVVIIDTAGRLHNRTDLMNELTKIRNVCGKARAEAPDEVLLVLDASTGQNAFQQAKEFARATNITSIAVTKLDGTAKGGVVVGLSDLLKVPVKYIGTGEGIEDIKLFDKEEFVASLFNPEDLK